MVRALISALIKFLTNNHTSFDGTSFDRECEMFVCVLVRRHASICLKLDRVL
jgi:hypothetical protein